MTGLRPRPIDTRLRELPVRLMPRWIVRLVNLVGRLLRRKRNR